MFKTKTTEKTALVKKPYNAALISRIQPQGNLRLDDERYIKTGDGYCSCIMVYSYPSEAYDFWLSRLMNIDGVYTVLDVATEESEDAQDAIVASLNELDVRYSQAKDEGSSIDAEENFKLLKNMLTSIKTQGEIIKLIQCRIYVAGRTKDEVDSRVADVIKNLEMIFVRLFFFMKPSSVTKHSFNPTMIRSRNETSASAIHFLPILLPADIRLIMSSSMIPMAFTSAAHPPGATSFLISSARR